VLREAALQGALPVRLEMVNIMQYSNLQPERMLLPRIPHADKIGKAGMNGVLER
jgi:hypothetical protein